MKGIILIGSIFMVAFFVIKVNSVNPAKKEILKTKADNEEFLYGLFPDGFMWGLATSAYQIEGAWNEAGKGPNSWDYWSHNDSGSNIADGKNGDIACDSYHKIFEDVALLKNMGAHFYRFSISWSRVIPTGKVSDGVNQLGLDYYNRLITALLEAEIQPFVTLYHWDLPLPLLEDGGWLNETINDHFADYARIVFQEFGDRVKLWLSFNEPHVFCGADWNYGERSPFVEPPEKPYVCAHNVVKSHAFAYRIYQKEFQPFQGGQMGITLNCDFPEPKDPNNPTHLEASERSLHFHYGLWANPLLRGEYPPVMRELIDRKSEDEGRNSSRLPEFDEYWTQLINGTLDFLGLNHYSTYYVLPAEDGESTFLNGDANIKTDRDPAWNSSGIGWAVVPFGFRKVMTWVAKEYGLPVYITENGFGGKEIDGLDDFDRVNYYWAYINEMLKSILLDGSDIRGYAAWSLLDNYEWGMGYTARFGVHYVDFEDPNLTRTPKESANVLVKIFADNGFPEPTS